MHYAPPNAELLQKLLGAFARLSYRVHVTLYEDESVRLAVRTARHIIVNVGLGVPW